MLSHYYDNITTLLSLYYCIIIALLWHHYNHYDRVSAPSLSGCADTSLLSASEHGEMIINLPWCLELDFNQQIVAQLSWEATRVTCQILLYTLFVPFYSLWPMSKQDCSCSKKVLRTADMLVAILGVTSSWGSIKQAVVDARRVETVQCCELSLHPATSREATKQLQPTPQVCRPPPIPSGRRLLFVFMTLLFHLLHSL